MDRLLLIIISMLLLSACEREEPESDEPVAECTVLVWLAGDNNLYSEVPHKLSADFRFDYLASGL